MAVQEDDEMTEGGASANDLEAVERVQLYLEAHGYGGKITVTDKTIFTVKDAANAIGVEEGSILKSLLLLVDGSPMLALLSGSSRLSSQKVKKLLGARRVHMAPPDFVYDYAGYKIGGVPPVCYPEKLQALLDENILKYGVVWAAAGSDHAFFPVSPEELARLTEGRWADICKDDVELEEDK